MKTDRSKHPQCRWCKRTIQLASGVPPVLVKWFHRHSGKTECQLGRVRVVRYATPPADFLGRWG